jgi:hypothetical protein
MKQAVLCIAPDVTEAEREVTSLREAGFATDDISVLWPDMAGAQELGYEQHTKAPEGMAWGVFFGAALGGAMAYLNLERYLVTPWTINLINAGPGMAILSGMAAFGVVGFILGGMIGLAFPEYEARKYERRIKVGSTLLAVHTDTADEVKTAEEALKRTSAIGIHHIEEASRCRSKCEVSKKIVHTGLILLLLGSCAGLSARAEGPAQPSPAAKADEQKATMPPDVTSKTVPVKVKQADDKPALQAEDITSVKTDAATATKVEKSACKTSVSCKKRAAIR